MNCRVSLLTVAFLLLFSPAADAQRPADASAEVRIDRVGGGWSLVEFEGNEDCAFGTPFRFFHRPARDARRLLIWFQGGGACWDFVSCSGMFDSSVSRDEVDEYAGIFDFENPANPLLDYAAVFIPYCTGDLHVGSTRRTYGPDGGQPINHYGARNVDSAVRWVRERYADAARIIVAGASAGSYAAIFHTPRIARLFPDASIVTIGDSGVPLLDGYPDVLEGWGAGPVLRTAWSADDTAALTLERANREASGPPNVRAVVHVTSDRDAIQSAFYLISGSPRWREETYSLLERLDQADGIRSFIVEGTDHGLLRTDAFYAYEAAGQSLAEWIAGVVGGDSVRSVRCSGCVVR